MQRICSWCNAPFTAPTTRARYCSGAHRAAAWKARGTARPAGGVSVTDVGPARLALEAWLLELRLDASHPLVPSALAIADRLDDPNTPTSGLSSVVDAMRTLIAALAPPRRRPAQPRVVRTRPTGGER